MRALVRLWAAAVDFETDAHCLGEAVLAGVAVEPDGEQV